MYGRSKENGRLCQKVLQQLMQSKRFLISLTYTYEDDKELYEFFFFPNIVINRKINLSSYNRIWLVQAGYIY